MTDTNTATLATPAGWTLLAGPVRTTVAETFGTYWFWRIATEAGEKSTVLTYSSANYHEAVIVAVKNVDQTNPFPVCETKAASAQTTANKYASATPPRAECMSLLCGGWDALVTGTPPTNWTEIIDGTGGYLAIRENLAGEATGEQTVTASSSHTYIGAHIIAQPPVGVKEGKASGTGTGTGTAGGVRGRQGKASGSGTGTGSGAGTRGRSGKASGSGAGSGGAAGTRGRSGKATGAGSGTGAAAGTRTRTGKATGTGTGSGTAAGVVTDPEGPNAIRVVERPPMRMRMLATTPSGRTYRWGEDSANPDQVFEDLSHSDSANGGYKDLTCSLARDPRVDYHDMERGARIELFGAGQMKVGEYRLERAPLVAGDKLVISPAAVGYEAALTDDSSAQEIYIDADISAWGEPSARRRALESAKNWKLNQNAQVQLVPAGTPDPDPTKGSSIVPAISHSWSQIETGGESTRDTAESWYNSGGVELGKIILDFLNVKGLTVGETSWFDLVGASANDKGEGYELLYDFDAVSQTAWVLPIGPGRYAISLEDFYGSVKSETGSWETQWRNMRVFGRHGLPLYGTWPNLGVLLSDVAANALSRWAPSINFTTGPYGTIKPTQFVIPHLAPKEPTTVADIIQQGARFELPEYGVWDDRTFYMNPRGQREGRKRWRVRARDVQLEDTGQQLDRVFNGVIVQGQATDGSTIYIAPAGSGLQVTSPRLLDTDPLNPANQAGIKRYAKIQMKGVCTYEGMLEAGEAFLEQAKLLDASGKATITGFVEDEHGREWPYYCVKGGDEIEVIGSSIPGYRYAINSGKSRASRSAGVDIDAPPDSYEALMERLNAEFIGIGLGG